VVKDRTLNTVRVYYLPIPAYSYNDTYLIPPYGSRRLALRPEFKDYKKFAADVYRATDLIHGDEKPWIDKKSMYDIRVWFGFPSEFILNKDGSPKKARDPDGLFKLILDSLFEYAGFGDEYQASITGSRVTTDTDDRHHHHYSYTNKCPADMNNAFVLLSVMKVHLGILKSEEDVLLTQFMKYSVWDRIKSQFEGSIVQK
jgi:hypothetical protein